MTKTLSLLTILNTLAYMNRYLMAALLPPVSAEFTLSNERAGMLVSAFVLGYFLSSPLFGFLGDRWFRPKLLVLGVLLWSGGSLWSSVSNNLLSLVISRVLVGLGEACYVTIAPAYLKDISLNTPHLNKMYSIFWAAIPIGSALGYVLGGFMIEAFSWRSAFVVSGLSALVFIPFLLRLRETRKGPRYSDKNGSPVRDLKILLKNPDIKFVILGYIFNAFALNGIATFISKYGVELGLKAQEVNKYFGFIVVTTGFIGTIGGGFLCNWYIKGSDQATRKMFQFIAFAAFCAVPFVGLAFLVEDYKYFLAFCFIAELFIFGGIAPVNSLLSTCCPPNLVSLSQATSLFMINVFGTLPAPLIVGFVADRASLSLGLQITTLALLLSGFFWGIRAKAK